MRRQRIGYRIAVLTTCAVAMTAWMIGANSRTHADPSGAREAVLATGLSSVTLTGDPVCVFGFSKDACEGGLSGRSKDFTCTRNGVECRTSIVQHATLKFPIVSNPDACADPFGILGRCDEAPSLDGTIVIEGEFTFRRQGPCILRGCWSGDFKLITLDGATVASGTARGTLGTGTHRAAGALCLDACLPDCERCYAVAFVPFGAFDGNWEVHLEGCLEGAVTVGEFESSAFCVNIAGILTTPGTVVGPDSVEEWRYCGTADGVLLAKCK